VIRRARSRLGENRYRLLRNNCEHFCEWCVHGISRSLQVERVLRFPATFVRTIRAACDLMCKRHGISRHPSCAPGALHVDCST
jgi:hypothetical protein